MMQIQKFDQVQSKIQSLYQESRWAEALALATDYAGTFPEQEPLLYYWRICMAARLGQLDLSISLLDEALNKGIWYGEFLLRKSPSLLDLQELPTFLNLIGKNNQLHDHEQEQQYPLITIRPQQECKYRENSCPLLIGLHANASTAQASMNFWKAAAGAGWLVAVPQSSQGMWSGSYVWDDMETSKREIISHYQTILERYAIEYKHVILAGHSMGGEVAIWLTLAGAVPARGFISIGPAGLKMDQPEKWVTEIDAARSRILNGGALFRGYIIVGENDLSIHQHGISDLAKMLNQSDIECQIEILPGVSHEFSTDYEDAILRGIDFIENQ